MSPCAAAGKFNEAYDLIRNKDCPYIDANIVMRQSATDPVGAQRHLSSIGDQAGQILALTEMSQGAAKKGDVADATHLAEAAMKLSGKENTCLDCIRNIARAWVLQGKPAAAFGWARSRTTSIQRGYALLGIAEAMAHRRPLNHRTSCY